MAHPSAADPIDVTVIIPTFNRRWCLPDAIDSCRQMSCSREIIVVDDGSNDGTWDWLQSRGDIMSLHQSNSGKCHAVNRAFELARGDYVRFLDSDDLLPSDATDAQLSLARTTGADVVVAGYTAWDSQLGTYDTRPWTPCDDFLAQQLGECDSSHYSAYLFRRTFLHDVRHRPEYAFRDDRMFVIEMALRRPAVAVFDRPGLIHRHHGQDRLQFRPGIRAAVSYWQERELFVRCAGLIDERGELTPRRRRAISASLWPVARRIGFSDVPEAVRLLAWLRQMDSEFRIPGRDRADRLYSAFGFSTAQAVVNAARSLRNSLQGVRALAGRSLPPSASSRERSGAGAFRAEPEA